MCGMQRHPTPIAVLKELTSVERKLDGPGLTGADRLALLRRQAQLGDLRDALVRRERRAVSETAPP